MLGNFLFILKTLAAAEFLSPSALHAFSFVFTRCSHMLDVRN